MILNSVFKDVVVANTDEIFDGCTFTSGTTAKQKGVFGLSITGNANVMVKNCKFANKGYSAIYMDSDGDITIENNEFDCTGLYNPIEGASGADGKKLTRVDINGNVMNGICGNNYFNFYNMEENSVINMNSNSVNGMSQQAEVVRISNLSNKNTTINIKNTSYDYDMTTQFDENWTKFMLCQDYTGNKGQNFGKVKVNIDGLYCNGEKALDKDNIKVGGLYFVYDNNANGSGKARIITDNDPVITFK